MRLQTCHILLFSSGWTKMPRDWYQPHISGEWSHHHSHRNEAPSKHSSTWYPSCLTKGPWGRLTTSAGVTLLAGQMQRMRPWVLKQPVSSHRSGQGRACRAVWSLEAPTSHQTPTLSSFNDWSSVTPEGTGSWVPLLSMTRVGHISGTKNPFIFDKTRPSVVGQAKTMQLPGGPDWVSSPL